MQAAWYRARADLRRWKPLVALVLIVGLAGGIVLTTVAGARRSSTAYDRFRDEARAADLDISPSDPDPALLDQVRRLPQVEVFGRAAFPFIRPAGTDLYPYLDFLAIVGPEGTLGTEIDRPRLIDGRMPRPDDPTELMVSTRYADEAGVEVGDRVGFESFGPDQFGALFDSGEPVEPTGPELDFTVVGVFSHPDLLSESLGFFEPRVFLSAAFYDDHREDVGIYERGGGARLVRGDRDAPAVISAVREIYAGDPELEITAASERDGDIEDSIGVLVASLLLCAACAAVAGIVAVGQALARQLKGPWSGQAELAAMGMGRGERIAALGLSLLPVVVAGPVLAALLAAAASPLMPVGVARRADPDLGFSFDGVVLVAGTLLLVLVTGILVAVAAWSASRVVVGEAFSRAGNRSSLRLLAGLGLSPAATAGTAMAVDAGRGRTYVPVRSAMAGAAFGVAGVVAVGVFASSLGALVDDSSRYGSPWDALVAGFEGPVDEYEADLAADPRIEDLTVVRSSIARIGDDELNLHSFRSVEGSSDLTLLDGRMPERSDEVTLGSDTLDAAGAGIGDRVEIAGPAGTAELTVVGRAAFPRLDERSAVAAGAAVSEQTLERIVGADGVNSDLLVTWAAGVDETAAMQELSDRSGTPVFAPRLPSGVNNLKLVEGLPRALAALLGVLAVVAVLHALVTSAHRRRQEFAVLRTLGFVRRQLSGVVAWQASTLVTLGLLVGLPLGLVVGRLAWRVEAGNLGVLDDPEVPGITLVLIVLGTLVVANLLARASSRIVRRLRPAAVLRST